MLSIPWIPTNIALLLPPVFVECMYLSPKWSYFFQLFSRPKVGLNPSLMLNSASFQWVCISPQRPWCFCLRPSSGRRAGDGFWFLILGIVSKSAWILPSFSRKICFLAWLLLRSPSFWFLEEQRFLTENAGLLDVSPTPPLSSPMNKSSWAYLKILSSDLYKIKKSSGKHAQKA